MKKNLEKAERNASQLGRRLHSGVHVARKRKKRQKKTKLLQYRETCKRGLGRMSWDTRLPSPRLATFDRVGLVLRDLKLLLDMGCACELIMYG